MGSFILSRALLLALACSYVASLTPLSAAGDDNDCALYLSGPGRTSAYDYTLNLLKGNFGYEGQHTCITYDAVNQAYLEARNRIVVSQPKGEWKAEDFASVGELILDISINLARRYGLTYEEIEKGLPLIDTSRTLIRDVCPPVFSHVECRAGKYRRLDGLCNNLQHPTWGSTMAPFQRLLGPLFADGINAPRIAHTGRDLPLSRVVSRTMHPDEGFHDHAGTVMVIAWGQFMDHDYTLTGTPLDPLNRNDPEECCKRPPHLKHPYCNEIRIPDDDYFYRLWNVKCIDFVRAFPSPRPGCRLGSRVPFNTLTGVIDGNTVYGVTDKFARKLRTGFGGLLRMNPVFKEYGLKDLLPLKLDIPDEGCTRPNSNMYCFEAGEIRVNEQLVLTVMHTLMAREHNRIAKALAHVNPHWDDETLFQEARRINVAEIQHITYNEFLPILLGKDVMEKFGLVLEKEGFWDGYDPSVNPDVVDAFASAAFRFGHSLLPTAVERWSKAHKFIASKRLSDLIRRPFDLYRAGVLDEYVMGLMNQVAQAMDDSITQEVTNHLFKKVGARFGMDLVSFNMQRGREFGIPGYMEFRKFCGLNGANSFQDLFGSMPNETVRKYETIFEHPIDVDLWSGGVSERPLPGSMLGPTFACVIATQFSYSRRGDRFWFELPNQPSSFTPEQLVEIRKARLARVICDNTDIIDTVQLYPMVLPDHELNPRVPCRSGIIPSIDFSKWAEPAPPFHGAKPFVTEANATKNETENNELLSNTKVKDSHNNDTVLYKNKYNDSVKDNGTNKIDSPIINCNNTSPNCGENLNKCAECKNKLKETHRTDTVLKYVYKKDDKVVDKKANSHPTNSVKRKKRSVSDRLINAASAPLIVNYETSHGLPNRPTFERQTANIIKNTDLADFNIETLHDVQPNQNKNSDHSEEIVPRQNNKVPLSQSQEDERSEESEENKTNEESHKDINDSTERGPYTNKNRNKSGEDSSENNKEVTEHYRKNNHSEGQSEENDEYKNGDSKRIRKDDSREQGEYKNSEPLTDNSGENHDDSSKDTVSREPHYNDEDKNGHSKGKSDGIHNKYQTTRKPKNTHLYSREINEYRRDDDTQHSPSPYREQSNESSDFKESEPSNSRSKEINESNVEDTYRDSNSQENSDNDERKSHNNEYEISSKDSNEGGERSEESSYPKHDSRENRNNNKLSYSKSESNERENSNDQLSHPRTLHPYKPYTTESESNINDKLSLHAPESEEEEAIIAIMKKKKTKPVTQENHYNVANAKEFNRNSPLQIRDVDLGDFNNYERIHVNSKGVVVPVTDNYENYDALSVPLISPLSTLESATLQLARSTNGADTSKSSENNQENKRLVHIDDEEVKPVIELNPDKEQSLEDNSKEAIKSKPEEDTSLETLLGVKLESDEKNDKISEPAEEQGKDDVKQQFERIPLNYNHVKKEQEQNYQPAEDKSSENESENKSEKTKYSQEVDDTTTKEPIKYDEHLNIKFDDISIKLPEIKLPQDILAIPDEDLYYEDKKEKGKKKPTKKKFYHYDEQEYNQENPHGPDNEAIHNHEDYDNHEPSYYGHANDYRNKDKHDNEEEEEEEEEEEDLYEKFVRERFGKSGTFKKRSEKLSTPSIPSQENDKLFQALNLVLKKASNIEKEAQKSGDPSAGYMWTVEYGQPL